MSGYSGTPLAKKLGIGAGCRLFWSALKLMVRKEARHAWRQGAERAPRAARAAGGGRR